MTEKQRRFVEEYLIDLNATQAAIRAGYSVRSASKIGSELLQKTRVRARVDEAMAERSKRTGINQDRVLRELARVAFVNPPDVVDMDDATVRSGAADDDTAAIASVKVKTATSELGASVEREVRFADKLRALELLGRHFGMWLDRHQVDATLVQIVDDIPTPPGGDET